mmetsp:Transcript_6073/g.10474  ORF Transcript_6073/g.10474 Transcript_6073/m.10474 type:complete len:522 (+) Transcript_6073:83-1648(+)
MGLAQEFRFLLGSNLPSTAPGEQLPVALETLERDIVIGIHCVHGSSWLQPLVELCVIGAPSCFGAWDANKAVPVNEHGDLFVHVDRDMLPLDIKFVIRSKDKLLWERGENHRIDSLHPRKQFTVEFFGGSVTARHATGVEADATGADLYAWALLSKEPCLGSTECCQLRIDGGTRLQKVAQSFRDKAEENAELRQVKDKLGALEEVAASAARRATGCERFAATMRSNLEGTVARLEAKDDEIAALTHHLQSMSRQLVASKQQLSRAHDELAEYDAKLSGLVAVLTFGEQVEGDRRFEVLRNGIHVLHERVSSLNKMAAAAEERSAHVADLQQRLEHMQRRFDQTLFATPPSALESAAAGAAPPVAMASATVRAQDQSNAHGIDGAHAHMHIGSNGRDTTHAVERGFADNGADKDGHADVAQGRDVMRDALEGGRSNGHAGLRSNGHAAPRWEQRCVSNGASSSPDLSRSKDTRTQSFKRQQPSATILARVSSLWDHGQTQPALPHVTELAPAAVRANTSGP